MYEVHSKTQTHFHFRAGVSMSELFKQHFSLNQLLDILSITGYNVRELHPE